MILDPIRSFYSLGAPSQNISHLLPLNQRTPEVNTPLTRLVGSAFPLPRNPDYVFSYRGTNRQGCPHVRPRRPTHVLEAHLARPLPSAPSAFRGKPSPCVRTHQRAFYWQTDRVTAETCCLLSKPSETTQTLLPPLRPTVSL